MRFPFPDAGESVASISSVEEEFLSLANKRRDEDGPLIVVSEAEVERIFNGLKPITTSFLIGDWDGVSIDTGHAGHGSLVAMRWAGKRFRSDDDADPIMVLDDAGARVCNEEWGHSSLREMVYRGVTSAAMIYDIKPIFDHFRCVNQDMVLGAMDCPKIMGTESTLYFFLTRRK